MNKTKAVTYPLCSPSPIKFCEDILSSLKEFKKAEKIKVGIYVYASKNCDGVRRPGKRLAERKHGEIIVHMPGKMTKKECKEMLNRYFKKAMPDLDICQITLTRLEASKNKS